MGADQAYLEGADAARNGRDLSANKYDKDKEQEEYLSWIDGYNSVKSKQ